MLCFIWDIHGPVNSWFTSQTLKGLSRSLMISLRSVHEQHQESCVLSGKYMTVCLNECKKCMVRRNDQTLRILLNQLPTICPCIIEGLSFYYLCFKNGRTFCKIIFTYYKVAPFVFSSSEENEQGTNWRQLSSAVSSSPFSTICFLAQCLNGVRNR